MPPLFQQSPALCLQDVVILQPFFSREIKDRLPVDASVSFWPQNRARILSDRRVVDRDDFTRRVASLCASCEAACEQDVLILPIRVADGDDVAAVVTDIDPGLLVKMAPEWLRELRDTIQKRLEEISPAFVDPITTLYNSRSLTACLEQVVPEDSIRILFFIGVGVRNRKASAGLLKTVQVAHFIESMSRGPVFYLGGHVFGLLEDNMPRQQGLDFARRLLVRLKREGLHHVHIGISVQHGMKQNDNGSSWLDECWQALETAERRGPFSLCEAAFLRNQGSHPLSLPADAVLGRLRRKWRGLKRFGLVLFRIDKPDDKEIGIEEILSGCKAEGLIYIAVSPDEGYVLLPDLSGAQTLQWSREIKAGIELNHSPESVALGVCHWPCLDYSKTAMAGNCRKALMHGRFLGPGAVTAFDHLSLNVSGDLYFDEGDYRQAVREYKAGVRMNPDDVNLMNSLGVALTGLNRHRRAVDYFNRVLNRDPGNFMALVNMGFALRMLGRDEEALASFEKACRSEEYAGPAESNELALQLGRLYCNAGQYAEALQVLEPLESGNPAKQELYLYRLLGEAYMEIGQEKKAMRSLQRALHIDPQDAHSLSMLGLLYSQAGEGDDIALGFCRKAVVLDERNSEHWQRLGRVLLHLGQQEEARAAVQKSLRLRRNNIAAILLMAKVYTMMGRFYLAEKRYERVLRMTGPDGRYHNEARKELAALNAARKTKR